MSGRWKPCIRTVKRIWVSTSTAGGTLKPLGNIGVWCSWPLRSCLWIVSPRHRPKVTHPSKPSGKRVASKPKRSYRPLILYAHERLQLGQRAEDIFAHMFAKQQTAIAR